MTKLDRLARSFRNAHEIAEHLAKREVKLNIGASVHDPTDPTVYRAIACAEHKLNTTISSGLKAASDIFAVSF